MNIERLIHHIIREQHLKSSLLYLVTNSLLMVILMFSTRDVNYLVNAWTKVI